MFDSIASGVNARAPAPQDFPSIDSETDAAAREGAPFLNQTAFGRPAPLAHGP